jgi:hypothetical protein
VIAGSRDEVLGTETARSLLTGRGLTVS